MTRSRAWIWPQLIVGWLPVWALYTLLIVSAHARTSALMAAFAAFQAILVAALLGLLVQRLTERVPWPRPLRPGFMLLHLAAASLFSVAWMLLTTLTQIAIHHGGALIITVIPVSYFIMGVWLYVMVAGVSYATSATERAARAEAIAVRSQLAALRSQLNPHFLFNALHAVVQLIPREPARAQEAAEQVAGLLRTAMEEDRDLLPLAEEWAFVERYLDLERIRFGDRLDVQVDLGASADALLPSFALQTLVENAVRHGAAPRIEPTRVDVSARMESGTLIVTVRDNGAGAGAGQIAAGGSGLQRLRERLGVLFGTSAGLELSSPAGGGFQAVLRIPQAGLADRDGAGPGAAA